jgi:3-phenylpropionate/trans-cinnamate dioxygenase ferredoxin subunit
VLVTAPEKIYICPISEISPDKPFVFRLNSEIEMVIFQRGKDYFALENRCPHAGAHLHEGILKDNILTCIWHGWKFDIESGQCITEYWARIKAYPVIVEEDELYLQNK